VLIWIGVPQLLILPLVPKIMRRFDPRRMATLGYLLFILGSLLASPLSGDFSGPQFISSSLVRAVAQALVMTPLSAIAVAGMEREHAGSASALFNMSRNLGGAIGIAVLQTVLTAREHFHSVVLTSQVSLLDPATRARLAHLTQMLMSRNLSDPSLAWREAVVAVGRAVQKQASIMAFSDVIILQSALLGLALLTLLFLKRSGVRSGAVGH
jgi:DHA2 family multidrug resistance protein